MDRTLTRDHCEYDGVFRRRIVHDHYNRETRLFNQYYAHAIGCRQKYGRWPFGVCLASSRARYENKVGLSLERPTESNTI